MHLVLEGRTFLQSAIRPSPSRQYLGEDTASLTTNYTLGGRSFDHVVGRLDSLLMRLKSCKAKSCHKPWSVLHPNGDVNTLKDALHDSFGTFYHEQPKASFSSCQLGYLEGVAILSTQKGLKVSMFGMDTRASRLESSNRASSIANIGVSLLKSFSKRILGCNNYPCSTRSFTLHTNRWLADI